MGFLDWLFGRGRFATTGEYQYQTAYWITFTFIALILATFIFLGCTKKLSPKTKNIILKSIAWFGISFEVLWRVIYMARGDKFEDLWPFYPCNLAGILVPLAVLFDNKLMKKMFYIFALIGGALTYAFPEGIFCNPVVSFPILKSILQHTTILFIPAFELASGTFKIRLADFKWMILGLFIHLLNSEIMGQLLGNPETDYIFLNQGLPFAIPGVPQFLVTTASLFFVMAIIYFSADYKRTNQIIQKMFKKKPKEQIDVENTDKKIHDIIEKSNKEFNQKK